ncbi:TAFII55 protein, conserved region [Dillenia turbinata]|uniref:TAFII55 protein, conserved region n=1 Tax=Dillenia turbinata TaxID=194707 RepID=A0AAN8Z9U7_9MAGN
MICVSIGDFLPIPCIPIRTCNLQEHEPDELTNSSTPLLLLLELSRYYCKTSYRRYREIARVLGIMEEQFVLRVPPSVAERIEQLLNENASSSDDKSLDLSFSDIGQMIMVREEGDSAPDVVEYRHGPTPNVVEYRHGLTPPMRDARRRRFHRELDLNPELVRCVEKDLLNIMAVVEQEEDREEDARKTSKKLASAPAVKPDAPETEQTAAEPDRSDSDESDDSI